MLAFLVNLVDPKTISSPLANGRTKEGDFLKLNRCKQDFSILLTFL
jgi:hypothetical protein